MTATTITLDHDVFRLAALLDRLEPQQQKPCDVEGCTHSYLHEMHELEAA